MPPRAFWQALGQQDYCVTMEARIVSQGARQAWALDGAKALYKEHRPLFERLKDA